MKKKEFDCVEMKHRAADNVSALVRGLSCQDELTFWAERTAAMRRAAEVRKQHQPA